MKLSGFYPFVLLFLVFVTGSPVSLAQTAAIHGIVIDQISQEPLPFANVLLIGTNLGAAADAEGNFVVADVPYGTYQVRATLVGYQPTIISDVVVAAGKQTKVVVKLDQMPIGLSGVEVTASFFQKNPDAAVSTQYLAAEEIRRSPGGFEDILRAVAVLPGVAQSEGGRNDLVVRGGAPSENLYVLDEVEIPNINHFGTQGSGAGSLSYVNLDFVRETAFSTGGFGVRYGDRMSSFLKIDLRDGRTDRIGGKATISATQFGVNLEGPFNENGTFIFSARRSYLDIIFRAAGLSFVPEYWDFLGRVHYKLDTRNTLNVMAIGAIDDVIFFNDDATARYENSRVLGTDQNQYASGITWEHLFGGGFANLTLGRSYVTYNGVQNDSLLRPIFTNQSKEGETSLKTDGVFKLGGEGKDELSFGAGVKRVKFNSSIALPGFVTSFGDTLDVAIQDVGTVGYKGSTYVQLLHHLPVGLQVVLGGRLDYFSLIEKKFYLSPRASLTWEVTPLTSVTASAGMYTQFPSYIWLVADPVNRSLSAARADQFILGVEHLLQADLKLRIEGFVKQYRDYPASADRTYLVLANTGVGYGGSEENFETFGLDRLVSEGTGRSDGVEFLAQKKLSEIPLYGILSFTFARTRYVPLDGVERTGAFDQRILASLSGGYRFDDAWEASMRFRFSTGRPYTPFNPDGTQNVSQLYEGRLKDFHALDLRVDRRWNFNRWNLVVYLDIQNVYNNKAMSGYRWNSRENRVEEKESGIGLLPSIGVSAEF